MPTWLIIAAGVVAIAHLFPQSRDKVKDVPWLSIGIVVGLRAVADSIDNVVKKIGSESTADSEERFDIEVLQDSTVPTPRVLGHVGNQEVQGNLTGLTLVKRRRLVTE